MVIRVEHALVTGELSESLVGIFLPCEVFWARGEAARRGRPPIPLGAPPHAHGPAVGARCGLGESEARRGPARRQRRAMQDAENVAAPEAAEQRAEIGQQQPTAEPPPGEEPARPSSQEAAGGEDEEAGPGPDLPAEPAADGEEKADATHGVSPPPPEDPPTPAASETPAEQARDSASETGSEGSGGEPGGAAENGGADEPSFSDPEDFVEDVSEEGEAAGPVCAEVPDPRTREGCPPSACRPHVGKVSVSAWILFSPKEEKGRVETTWGTSHWHCSLEFGGW